MSTPTFTAKTQEIIDALARIPKHEHRCDKAVIKSCWDEHFAALGMKPLPIRWVADAKAGYLYVVKAAELAARSAAESAARLAAKSAARSAAWSAARSAAWSAAESAARSAAWSAAWSAAESAAWSAAWSAAESAAESAAKSAAWSAAELAAKSAAWSAAELAAKSAAWSAAWFNCSSKPEVVKYAGIWLPFLKARDAGLWLYWVTVDEVVCCASPSLYVKDDRLHCEDGPAVSWPDSPEAYWYLKGVQVTEDIVRRRFGWRDIDGQTNAEVRRIMLEIYGTDRYITESGIKPVHQDEWGTLYRKEMPGDEPIAIVKVVNCTPEPDGSYVDYWIRVDPNAYGGVTTARAAVASTWRDKGGKLAFATPEAYCPAFES